MRILFLSAVVLFLSSTAGFATPSYHFPGFTYIEDDPNVPNCTVFNAVPDCERVITWANMPTGNFVDCEHCCSQPRKD